MRVDVNFAYYASQEDIQALAGIKAARSSSLHVGLAQSSHDEPGMQYEQLLNFSQGWRAIQLVRIRSRQPQSGLGKDDRGFQDAGVAAIMKPLQNPGGKPQEGQVWAEMEEYCTWIEGRWFPPAVLFAVSAQIIPRLSKASIIN